MNIFEKIIEINKLYPKKGDILVIKVPKNVSYEEKSNIHKYLQDILKESGFDNEIIVMDKEVEVSILRKEDIYD